MLVHALVRQFHDRRRSNIEKSSLPQRCFPSTRSSYPASELPAREQPVEEPGTELALTIVLAGAYAPPCTTAFRLRTSERLLRSPTGVLHLNEHVMSVT